MRRRRGQELEDELFDAVRRELAEHGYAGLTYEGVAAAAGTGKTVLYRRWGSRADMVLAALAASAREALVTSDTGSLGGDVRVLLSAMRDRLDEIGTPTIHSLIAELPAGTTETFRTLLGSHVDGILGPTLERARRRGELGALTLPPRALSLPFDLARHEMLISGALSPTTIDEIVDICVIPLWRTLSRGEGPGIEADEPTETTPRVRSTR
ncbi:MULTISPECIES: TetR/AcrR family transcriptional regulator [unclassified Gordonia (in: high G+C Gram-positive bacteria)]